MQITGEKQQYPWTNENGGYDLISSFENFKVLMEFKGKYFDGYRKPQ